MLLAFLRRHDSIGFLCVAVILQAVYSTRIVKLLALYLLVPFIWRQVAWRFALLVAVLLTPLVVLRERCVLRLGRGINVPGDGAHPLVGLNVFITGSSSGIGLFAADRFLRHGAHVAIHGSREKTLRVLEHMQATANKGPGRVTAVPFDLQDFEEVRNASVTLRQLFPQIHVLVLSAAIQGSQFLGNHTGKSGHDKTMAINHLGHFLLFSLLEDVLAPGARVVLVNSGGAYYGFPEHLALPQRLPWEDPSFQGRFIWGSRQAYQDSKLAFLCFGNALQRRLVGRASVVSYDPGFVMTGPASMLREHPERRERWSYGPAWKGGENLFHVCFVEPAPSAPDWVIAYFLPREAIAWWVHWHPLERLQRHWIQTYFESNQQLTNGLHVTLAPKCHEPLQNSVWNWSAHAVGIAA